MKPKKITKQPSLSPEDQALEERVRRMMDPSLPDPEPVKPSFEVIKDDAVTAPELDIPQKITLRDDEPADAGTAIPVNTRPPAETKPIRTIADTAPDDSPQDRIVTDIDRMVDDIQKQESDELLAGQDADIAKAFDDKKPGFGQRIKNFFSGWWHNKRARNLTLAALAVLLVTSAVVPASRYFMLNLAGVRASASITILDDSTKQPLKNVTVRIRGQSAVTDQNGYAKLERLKLGRTNLVVEKRAFAPKTEPVTIGWGSNPLSSTGITPVGAQYSFKVTDFLSQTPIEKAEALSGEYSAFSDANGLIKLTIDDIESESFAVRLLADGYREEVINLDADTKDETAVKMAPARQHVFISKRSGSYDVYKIDADGKNEELVLKGTGSERDDIVLVQHPSEEMAALISTRNNQRNADGFLLSTLTLINLADNTVSEVTDSERIQLIDWVGDRLVYVRIAAGASGNTPDRHRLISYDYKTAEYTEIARSNYFNDVMIARGKVYYAPSSAYQTEPVAFYSANVDGSDKQAVLNQEVWNIIRTSWDGLTMSVGQDWHEYSIGRTTTDKLAGEPANLRSRVYVDSPDGEHSLWVDERDGKGVLLAYAVKGNEDKVLHTQSGLKTPVRWLNNTTVAFRISTDTETADYAVSLLGGEPVKIRDVTNTSGIDRWYYY